MTYGMFHVGKDDYGRLGWLGFACCKNDYNFEDVKKTAAYLQSFEAGKSQLSQRSVVPIQLLQIKRG